MGRPTSSGIEVAVLRILSRGSGPLVVAIVDPRGLPLDCCIVLLPVYNGGSVGRCLSGRGGDTGEGYVSTSGLLALDGRLSFLRGNMLICALVGDGCASWLDSSRCMCNDSGEGLRLYVAVVVGRGGTGGVACLRPRDEDGRSMLSNDFRVGDPAASKCEGCTGLIWPDILDEDLEDTERESASWGEVGGVISRKELLSDAIVPLGLSNNLLSAVVLSKSNSAR